MGRDRELEELEAALAESRAGHGRLFLVTGEPGIGKTRLAEALAMRAEPAGVPVFWGRCWENPGAPAFWPWAQVLRAVVRTRDDEHLRAELGAGATWIAQVVPEIHDRLAGLSPPDASHPEQARFALFDAIASFLREVAERDPFVIVLDDLHAADPASVLLLDFLARGIVDTRMLVIAACQEAAIRRRPELEETARSLMSAPRRIALRGFGVNDLARLVEGLAGGPPPDELVHALHETTEGNPLFANEVVRLLASKGQMELWIAGARRARFPLPDSVRDVIRRRFEPLGESGVSMLEAAAVIGREFHLPTLELVTGATREGLINLIGEAVAAGLVAEVPDAIGRFRFTHGLIRHTLYEGLGTAERVRLHQAVGEALERRYGDSPEHLSQLAHHFAQAAPRGEAERALANALRAGEHAMAQLAFEQAAELFDLALAVSELMPADPVRRAELLLALGQARTRSDQPTARATLIEAADAARAVERPALLAEAALGIHVFTLAPGTTDEAAVALLEEALGLHIEDEALRARLLARLAVALYYSPGTEERREALAQEAVAMARRLGDKHTLMQVLANAQLATWGPDTSERGLEWTEEVLRLSEDVHDVELALVMRNRQVDYLLELGDLAAADIALDALERMVAESPDPRARAYLPLQKARRASIEGRYDEAERLNAEASRAAESLGDRLLSLLAVAQMFTMHWAWGRITEGEQVARQFADAAPGMPAWRAGLAVIHCKLGREARARRELEWLAAQGFEDLPRYNGWLLTMALLADACDELGEQGHAAKLEGLLAPFAGRNVVVPFTTFEGPVSRYLGILAATRGDLETAAEHFAAARDAVDRINARPLMAWVRIDQARLLAARGGQGDRERAHELLVEAAVIATEVGAKEVAARAEELRQAVGDAGGRPPDLGGAPTTDTALLRREGEVWTFELERRSTRVRDSKGVRYLATLLARPGVEVAAVELAGAALGAIPASASRSATAGLEGEAAGGGDAGPALDAAAKSAYRLRLEDLREQLEEAEAFNDPERAARAKQEIDFLSRELAGALGLGGRDRRPASGAERARVSVTKAIRSAIKRVSEQDRELGRELGATIRTGAFCVYEPDPRRPLSWRIEGR